LNAVDTQAHRLDWCERGVHYFEMSSYRSVRFGIDRVASGDIPRHLHFGGYANVVLAGGFTEAAFAGRSRATAGTVLLHDPFDAHANVEGSGRGPTIIRLPWHGGVAEGAYTVRDPDLLARLVEVDLWEAERAMMEMLLPAVKATPCWPDELASSLAQGATFQFREWAEAHAISPSSLSRGFHDAYGVSPQRFRLEARTRLAWRRTMTDQAPLTRIAHDCAFSDLGHMTRSIAAMTGASPTAWRSAYVADERQ
jgi:AraC-like DNA-binding protein